MIVSGRAKEKAVGADRLLQGLTNQDIPRHLLLKRMRRM
jgi:hypothetical protein